MPADVNLNIDIDKKGEGDKEAAAGLELVARAADDAKDELAQLDRKLLETRAAMITAAKTFAQTGDISPFKALLKDQRELATVSKTLSKFSDDAAKQAERAAQRMRKAFEDALSDKGFFKGFSISNALIPEMEKTGLQAGEVFSGGFREALVSFAGPIGLVVGPPLVAAIGASIAGATLGGLGLGAIAAGVALQFKTPLVHDAVTEFGDYVKQKLTAATVEFGPAFAVGLQALRREVEPLWANLRAGFESLQPYVTNLLVRLGEGLAKLGPGLQHALEAAGPVLGELSKNIPTLLNAVGIFFEYLSRGGKGAALAIDAIVKSVSGLIVMLGQTLYISSRVFEGMAVAADKVTGVLAKIPVIGKEWEPLHNYVHGVAVSFDESKLAADGATGSLNNVSGSLAKIQLGTTLAGNDFATLSGKISATAQTSDALAGAMATKLLSTTMSLDQATLGFAQSQTQLSDSIAQNGRQLDIHTAKGQANRAAILGAVQANIAEYQTMIQAGDGADQASAAYDANTRALEAQLRKAGLTQQEIDGLIGKYRGVPADVNTDIKTYGLQEAINSLDDAIRLANNLDGRVSVLTIEEIHRTVYDNVGSPPPSQYFRGLATGGVIGRAASGVIANRPFIIGERTLPEAAIPAPNSGISQTRADMLLNTAASWWGRRLVPKDDKNNSRTMVLSPTINIYDATNPRAVADAIDDRLRELGRQADFLARTRG